MTKLHINIVTEVGAAMYERGFSSKEHNTLKILGVMDSHFEKMAAMAAKLAHTFKLSPYTCSILNQTFTMVSEVEDDVVDDDDPGKADILLAHVRQTMSDALFSELVKKRRF